MELVFEVVQEADGGYRAGCLTENIFTDGDTWEQLRQHKGVTRECDHREFVGFLERWMP